MAVSEVEQRLGYRLYERGTDRPDYRNGYRYRTVQLPFAVLTIKVPRLRGQGLFLRFLSVIVVRCGRSRSGFLVVWCAA